MVFPFFTSHPWDLRSVAAPWGSRPSIHRVVVEHLRVATTSLYRAHADLPDEEAVASAAGLRWVAGASDGVLGVGGDGAEDLAAIVEAALAGLVEEATDQRAAQLYAVLTRHPAASYLGGLLPMLGRTGRHLDRVRAIARWLATEAADREPVKAAIGILAAVSDGTDRELVQTLGRHEEFTLFSAATLQVTEGDAEAALWELGRQVTGWGRVHIVGRLGATRDPRIQAWLLRDGCRNDVMDEYTAYTCAQAGGLVEALRQPDPDDALLDGAGAMLSALARPGPAEDMESYADAVEAVERYLTHLRDRDVLVHHVIHVGEIGDYLEAAIAAGDDEAGRWRASAPAIGAQVRQFMARVDWPAKVEAGLASADRQIYWIAAQAARRLGIDAWQTHFERLRDGGDDWHFALETTDPVRMARVVALAEQRLPLDAIATGPQDSAGIGIEFQPHRSLDWLLQELRRFPGQGWPLLRAGLRSPVVRNRNFAVRALEPWERSAWPAEVEPTLRQALEAEPVASTRSMIQQLLDGQPLSW